MWIREIVIVENIRLGRLRWEFIKENKKVRKQELDQESDQEKKRKNFLGRVFVFLYSCFLL